MMDIEIIVQRVRLFSRNGYNFTDRCPVIGAAELNWLVCHPWPASSS
jgi:ATP-dependent DNA ligase